MNAAFLLPLALLACDGAPVVHCNCHCGCCGEEADDSCVPVDSPTEHTGQPDSRPPHTGDTRRPGDSAPDTAPPVDPIEALDPWVEPDVLVTPIPLVEGGEATVLYRGSLASGAKQILMDYGFDDRGSGEELELVLGADGWEGTLDVPRGSTALHMTFVDPDAGTLDDAAGLLYHASAEFPYLGPWLVWNRSAQPGSGILVSWETSVPCLGVLEYGTSASLGCYAAGAVTDTLHHVAVTGLSPGDVLYYRVWDSSGAASEVYTYDVPETADPYRFLAIADIQSYSASGRMVDTVPELIAAAPDAAFALSIGDLAGWDDPVAWWMYFHMGRDLWSWLPIVPVPGNHDGSGSATLLDGFYRYFHVSWTSPVEPWYSLDFGGTHILALCSNLLPTLAEGAGQYAFAEADLAGCWSGGVRTCDQVFAAFHVPPYNAGMRHFHEQYDVREVTALFDGTVDWHISGHEHVPQRTFPLQYDGQIAPSGDYGIGPDDGVGYLVVPTAGSYPGYSLADPGTPEGPARDVFTYPDMSTGSTVSGAELGFTVVSVDAAGITLETYATGSSSAAAPARLIDSVTSGL
ncbi:MAG: metallophosphoesterase family protein [Pseudomonadota bacterium]